MKTKARGHLLFIWRLIRYCQRGYKYSWTFQSVLVDSMMSHQIFLFEKMFLQEEQIKDRPVHVIFRTCQCCCRGVILWTNNVEEYQLFCCDECTYVNMFKMQYLNLWRIRYGIKWVIFLSLYTFINTQQVFPFRTSLFLNAQHRKHCN